MSPFDHFSASSKWGSCKRFQIHWHTCTTVWSLWFCPTTSRAGIWDTLNMLFHLIPHIYGLLKVTWPPATQVCAKGQLQGLAVIWSPEFDGSLKGSQWFDGETGRICLKATVWSSRWCARKWQVNKLWWLLVINKPLINPYWGGHLWWVLIKFPIRLLNQHPIRIKKINVGLGGLHWGIFGIFLYQDDENRGKFHRCDRCMSSQVLPDGHGDLIFGENALGPNLGTPVGMSCGQVVSDRKSKSGDTILYIYISILYYPTFGEIFWM